jgi:hypothetical protein
MPDPRLQAIMSNNVGEGQQDRRDSDQLEDKRNASQGRLGRRKRNGRTMYCAENTALKSSGSDGGALPGGSMALNVTKRV